jgi:hypothetical protein
MTSNQTYGYDPFYAHDPSTGGMAIVDEGIDGGSCYYGHGSYGRLMRRLAIFPDSTPYKQTLAELRQYIIELETTRRFENLSNVSFSRSPQPGDLVAYNYTTGKWELTDYVCGGPW